MDLIETALMVGRRIYTYDEGTPQKLKVCFGHGMVARGEVKLVANDQWMMHFEDYDAQCSPQWRVRGTLVFDVSSVVHVQPLSPEEN